jgi:hypothetical protein
MEATNAVKEALQARVNLWDGILKEILLTEII